MANLELLEGLFQLDPVRTYPARAAGLVARVARAGRWRLVLGSHQVAQSEPAPTDGETKVSLPIRHGKLELGTLDLYPAQGELGSHERELAKWGVRMLGRGLDYTDRLAVEAVRRTGEEVEDALNRAPLTPRERDVVLLLVGGFSTRDIAEQTGLAVSTINTYLKRIFSKLGVHSRVELVARMAGTDRASRPPSGPPPNSASPSTEITA